MAGASVDAFGVAHALRIALTVVPLLAQPAAGQLTSAERRCAAVQAAGLVKQARAAVKQLTRCAKRAARGKPLDKRNPEVRSVDACITLDPRGKFHRLRDKTARRADKRCHEGIPPFGVTDTATASIRAEASVLDLLRDVFGPDLATEALSVEKQEARCQRASWMATSKCHVARMTAFARCQKAALAAGAASAEELSDACLGVAEGGQPDPKGKLGRVCEVPARGIGRALAKQCAGEDVPRLLPPCGAGPDPAACLAARAACRVCEAVVAAGLLPRNCDLFDDGLTNGSCSGGPASLSCVSPAQGAMIVAEEGATVDVAGRLEGGVAPTEVTVNGLPVEVAADGSFSVPVATRFGTNVVELAAEDALGERYESACSFVAAERYLPEDAFLAGALSLKLRQPAIDDGARSDLDSLGDVGYRVLNSAGLKNQIHDALLAANPLKPLSCDQEVCVIGCFCAFESSVIYLSSNLGGPHDLSLELVTDGLHTTAIVRDVGLQVSVGGTISTSGWARFDSIVVDLTSDVGLAAGVPLVATRNVDVTVSAVDLDFPGLVGVVVDVLQFLFQGVVRSLVAKSVKDYLTHNLNGALSVLLSGLELPDATLDVSRIGESGVIQLTAEGALGSLTVSPERALFGIETRMSAPADHAVPSLGVPLLADPTSSDPATTEAVLFAAQLGVLNQALHALWRGGLFHGTFGAADAEGLPPGFVAELEASLPPVASEIANDRLSIGLGGLRAIVTLPGVFAEPTPLVVSVDASTDLVIVGDQFVFAEPTIETLHLAGMDETLGASERAALEAGLRAVLRRLLMDALDGSTLALDIPAFVVSGDLAGFGLPVGAELGIVEPSLASTHSHVHVEGPFGVR